MHTKRQPPKRVFENLNWCIVKYTSMCLYILVYINIIVNNYVYKNQYEDMQIRHCNECQGGMSMNVNEEMLAGYADPDVSYPDADPNAS